MRLSLILLYLTAILAPAEDFVYPTTPTIAVLVAAARAKQASIPQPGAVAAVKFRDMETFPPVTDNPQEVLEERKPFRTMGTFPSVLADPKGVLEERNPFRPLSAYTAADRPDTFSVNLAFKWPTPTSAFMRNLLADIKAAKAAGDTEAYAKMTAQYTAWIERSYGE